MISLRIISPHSKGLLEGGQGTGECWSKVQQQALPDPRSRVARPLRVEIIERLAKVAVARERCARRKLGNLVNSNEADRKESQLQMTNKPAQFLDELRQKLPQLRDQWRKL